MKVLEKWIEQGAELELERFVVLQRHHAGGKLSWQASACAAAEDSSSFANVVAGPFEDSIEAACEALDEALASEAGELLAAQAEDNEP